MMQMWDTVLWEANVAMKDFNLPVILCSPAN